MKLRWWQDDRSAALPGGVAEGSSAAEYSCPSLARVLEKILRHDKPEVLDISPFCGATAVYLADRGARVTVDQFDPPPPPPKTKDGEEPPPGEPLHIYQPDARFQLVLAGEVCDFVPPERLDELGRELNRLLAEGGYLLLFALNSSGGDAPKVREMNRFRIVADDRLRLEAAEGPARRHWFHPTRKLESALAPLAIQGIHLQRNQMREFLALKRAPRAPRT